jgi:hypothetical protein
MAETWQPDRELVDAVDAAMTNWHQGHVVSPGPLGWLADRSRPLTPQTAALGGSEFGFTQASVEHVVVATQTCDIVKSCWSEDPERGSWPLVQVCPVVTLKDQALAEASRGHSTRFAPLPALGNDKFADLTVCTTMDKAVLVGLGDPIPGCATDDERERFAAAVDRNRRRFAFPSGMDEVLKPLRARFRNKWKKDSPEGRRIAEIWEIRAKRADHTPWYGNPATQVEIELTFVVAPEALPVFDEDGVDEPVTPELKKWASGNDKVHELADKLESVGSPADQSFLWHCLVQGWVQKCSTDPSVVITGAMAESADDYSLARARLEPRLDLDHLSNR